MRTICVVVLPVVLGHALGLEQGVEHLDSEAFIAQPVGERFDVRVLPTRSGVD